MKWKVYICEDCQGCFALDITWNEPRDVFCPFCGRDLNVTATGECIEGSVVPDNEG